MEAIAFSQLHETKRTCIKALCDLSSLDKKLAKATSLQKRVCLREARKALYKDIHIMGENMNNLQALLRLPSTLMETCVVNQLRETKKKYIKALCEVRRLNGAQKKACNEEIRNLGKELNRLQVLLNRLRGESSGDDSEDSDSDSD